MDYERVRKFALGLGLFTDQEIAEQMSEEFGVSRSHVINLIEESHEINERFYDHLARRLCFD